MANVGVVNKALMKEYAEINEVAPVILVYAIPTSARMNPPPVAPSLFQYLQMAEKDADTHSFPMLGKLMTMGPGESGYVLNFIQHPGHPAAPVDADINTLSLITTPMIADSVVNGAVLVGLDNLCFGLMENGVLTQFIAFVEVEG